MKRLVCVLVLLVLLVTSVGCNDEKLTVSDDCLTVYFFDVGQADCSLLLFPDGKTMLIDAGNRADGPKISQYLNNLDIDTIDYFVLTHPHEDHTGGAKDIFNGFEVLTVCLPNIPTEFEPDTAVFKEMNTAIENEKCRTLKLNAGTVIAENEIYEITALTPDEASVYSDLNNWSLSLLIDCFTNTLIFTGDCEKPAELDMLNSKINLDADILKVGHHGSENSSSEDFLKAVTPLVSVISSGVGNTYNHPHAETVTRLNSIGSKIYRTDTVGTVIAKCYDGGFNIETDSSICLNGN